MAKRNRVMCVKIAKDVIEQLRLKRYVAAEGTYVDVLQSGILKDWMCEPEGRESFQKFFKENDNVTCEVCALGAAFVSLVNIENKCTVSKMNQNDHGMFDRLAKHFGYDNISLMESAFECTIMDQSRSNLDIETLEQAVEWGERYEGGEKRLRAIMLNVIRNNGDFKIPVKMLAKAHSMSQSDAGDDSW